MQTPVLVYELDSDLRLLRYESPHELSLMEGCVGMPFMRVVGNSTLAALLEVLYRNVAHSGKTGVAHYRCDTPHLRRHCSLVVTRRGTAPHPTLRIENFVDRMESRPYVRLLDARPVFSDALVCLCSWCKKLRLPDDSWSEIEEALESMHLMESSPMPRISHGMCPACYAYIMERIDSVKADEGSQKNLQKRRLT